MRRVMLNIRVFIFVLLLLLELLTFINAQFSCNKPPGTHCGQGDPSASVRVFKNGSLITTRTVCSQDLINAIKRNLSVLLQCSASQIDDLYIGDYNVSLLADGQLLQSAKLPKNMDRIIISHNFRLEDIGLISRAFECFSNSINIENCIPTFDCASGKRTLTDEAPDVNSTRLATPMLVFNVDKITIGQSIYISGAPGARPITIDCNVTNNVKVDKYVWERNGVILNFPSTQMSITVTQTGAYKCTASNVCGSSYDISLILYILSPNCEWTYTNWSNCSHCGIHTRTVQCLNVNTSENCPESECPPPKPKSEEECNHLGFTAKWVAGPWSECSRTCGGGYRTRTVTCQKLHPAATCIEARPRVCESCNLQACCTKDLYPHICNLVAKPELCKNKNYKQFCCWTCSLKC